MDKEQSYLVAMPFKKRGKKSMKMSDFIFALSLDLKWGSPEKVRALLRMAEKEGMVSTDGDMLHANFDLEAVEIPLGFKPATEEGIFERGVRLITQATGMTKKEVIALVNERQDSLKRLVDLDAVVLVVARELGIDVKDLASESYLLLISQKRGEDEAV